MSNFRNSSDMTKPTSSRDSIKNDKKKKSIISNIFNRKDKTNRGSDKDLISRREIIIDIERRFAARRGLPEAAPAIRKGFSDRNYSKRIEGLNLSSLDIPKRHLPDIKEFRVYVATWNVGGKPPNSSLNLEDFLQVEGNPDIYVIGFQEIVPLNAGNVLVLEDNEPATKWLALICQALNSPRETSSPSQPPIDDCFRDPKNSNGSSVHFFQKSNLKLLSKNFRVDSALVKACNCSADPSCVRRRARDIREFMYRFEAGCDEDAPVTNFGGGIGNSMNYCLVASKQMVGLFYRFGSKPSWFNISAISELPQLGEALWVVLVISHLASGEKEGDELRRNSDVAEILKSTQFPKICKLPGHQISERILDHERIIWLGDLNYRVALSYDETKSLLEDNDWDTLLERDQLKMEKEAGRVFKGWKEGKIYFAPTYKYSQNSDSYAGETVKSKKKRRTPAWCDRILWHGDGIEQLQYIRGESRFSDHRPVCAVFTVQVDTSLGGRGRKAFSALGSRIPLEDVIPQRHSFYDF